MSVSERIGGKILLGKSPCLLTLTVGSIHLGTDTLSVQVIAEEVYGSMLTCFRVALMSGQLVDVGEGTKVVRAYATGYGHGMQSHVCCTYGARYYLRSQSGKKAVMEMFSRRTTIFRRNIANESYKRWRLIHFVSVRLIQDVEE